MYVIRYLMVLHDYISLCLYIDPPRTLLVTQSAENMKFLSVKYCKVRE